MIDVDLFTAGGGFVERVAIPPFIHRDGLVLQWGSRHFVWNEKFQQFREGLCFVIIPQYAYEVEERQDG